MKKLFSALALGVLLSVSLTPFLVEAQNSDTSAATGSAPGAATTAQQDIGSQPKNLLPEDVALADGVTVDCVRFMKQPNFKVDGLSASSISLGQNKKLNPDNASLSDLVRLNATGKPAGGVFLKANGLPVAEGQSYTINFRDTALTCGIKTGRIDLWMVPYYLVRVIDFGLLLSGMAAVLFIIIGGYHMIIGSYTEDKEKGKKTIMYALLGLVLSLLSYTIVNLLLLFLTA